MRANAIVTFRMGGTGDTLCEIRRISRGDHSENVALRLHLVDRSANESAEFVWKRWRRSEKQQLKKHTARKRHHFFQRLQQFESMRSSFGHYCGHNGEYGGWISYRGRRTTCVLAVIQSSLGLCFRCANSLLRFALRKTNTIWMLIPLLDMFSLNHRSIDATTTDGSPRAKHLFSTNPFRRWKINGKASDFPIGRRWGTACFPCHLITVCPNSPRENRTRTQQLIPRCA